LMSQFTCVADVSTRLRLRSISADKLNLLSFYLSTVGARSFPIAGTYIWNVLPVDVTFAA